MMFAPTHSGGEPQVGYPIIPLTPRLRVPIEIEPLDMPRPHDVSLEGLKRLVHTRAKSALGALVDHDLPTLFPALAGMGEVLLREGARDFGAHVAKEWGGGQIEQALKDVAAAFDP